MAGVAIVVFSDLVDSTALLASLGDDRMEGVRRAHVRDVAEAVTGSGGRVIKTLGDGVMSSFDSALGALRAAAAIQAAVERLDGERGGIGIAARVGVAAGEPIADGEDLHGMSVVIASRLSSAAGTGQVLVQDVVGALVASRDGVALEEAREYELKGVPSPVRASQLLWRDLDDVASAVAGDGLGGDAESEGADPRAVEATSSPSPSIRLPPILDAYAEEPLIGRDREIGILREWIAPRAGRRAVVVSGEPGIGKTRHAAAAAGEAHAAGSTVVLARCPPDPVVPFEPWVRAIGELALAGDAEWRRALAGAGGPELAALVPELEFDPQPGEAASAGAMVAAEGARYRLLRGIGAALGHAAEDRPLHVVLDDAQWCDPASAQALRHLLDTPPAAELALVVTARAGEMGRRHPVSAALADLRRTGDLGELQLTGLDATGMAALVGARVGRAITPGLAERLLERTAGNPFFAAELVRDLDGRGALRDGEALDAAPVPDAVTGLVEERLAQIDPATEQLLTAVAAIGPSAPVDLAARAAGLDPETAERATGDALAERLVEDVASAEPTIAFTHALVREALIAGMADAARARLHLAVARALEEDPAAEPAELARHYGLAVDLVGAAPALAAHRAAATSAAEGHDHEAAAAHLRQILALLPAGDTAARAPVLLELGEQDLLSADLVRAREAFRGAAEAARETGDSVTLACAALGFAGGDIGFGWEVGGDDPASVALLREGLEALGDSEPLLALRMNFRLAYMLIFSDDDAMLESLARRAEELGRRIASAEARVLARYTVLVARFARRRDPFDFSPLMSELGSMLELLPAAEECGREDLLFRAVQASAWAHYTLGDVAECERAIERGAEIAARLGSPRFVWEVELNRAMRLFERGGLDDARTLARISAAAVSRMRPDIQIFNELGFLVSVSWLFEGDTEIVRLAFEAVDTDLPRGGIRAGAVMARALDGDLETARRQLRSLLDDDLEPVRRADGHLPMVVGYLAEAAIAVGDREAGARLMELLEPLRGLVIQPAPIVSAGHLPEAYIGRLELLAGNAGAAVAELRVAVSRADELEMVWASPWIRAELARALHRDGEADEALRVLAEAEAIADRHGAGWAARCAAEVRAEIEGREPPPRPRSAERAKPIRALGARGARRAFAAMVSDLDDAALERRFAEPRRQRAVMRAMARGFQPSQAGGFAGTVVYELEPYAIEPPPDAPWRWAIEVDAGAGRARLVEPAPLDAAVTLRFGLADWARVMAGADNPLAVMARGRGSIEGDLTVAIRLEAMFGGA
jgi:class 3 adenylate cyclase/tetratricopeptide (TPR) repeat protein